LWNVGVRTFDISMKKSFVMRTALMWTINDVPAYADLSGWSTRGPLDGDQGTASKDLVQVPIGLVTRARAKKFKDVLNGLIQELWAQANSWRPIEHDPRGQQRIVTLIQVLEKRGQG